MNYNEHKTPWFKVSAIVLLGALYACNPGVQEFNDAILLDQLIDSNVDATQPVITATSPASSSTNIELNATISVTFSKAMAQQTIATNTTNTSCSGSVQVSSDGFTTCVQMSTAPTASSGNTVFTVTPTTALSPGTTYRIRVTTAATDADANALASTFTSGTGFKTRLVVFVSATTTQGNMNGVTGIAGADAICAADANKPATGTYRAMLVDAGGTRTACTTANCSGGTAENTNWVFLANTSYYRTDGTTLIMTTNAGGVFDFAGMLNNSFATGGTTYWTGLMSDWRTDTRHCSNWTSIIAGGGFANQGEMGSDVGTSGTSISAGGGSPNCDTLRSLLCVQQ